MPEPRSPQPPIEPNEPQEVVEGSFAHQSSARVQSDTFHFIAEGIAAEGNLRHGQFRVGKKMIAAQAHFLSELLDASREDVFVLMSAILETPIHPIRSAVADVLMSVSPGYLQKTSSALTQLREFQAFAARLRDNPLMAQFLDSELTQASMASAITRSSLEDDSLKAAVLEQVQSFFEVYPHLFRVVSEDTAPVLTRIITTLETLYRTGGSSLAERYLDELHRLILEHDPRARVVASVIAETPPISQNEARRKIRGEVDFATRNAHAQGMLVHYQLQMLPAMMARLEGLVSYDAVLPIAEVCGKSEAHFIRQALVTEAAINAGKLESIDLALKPEIRGRHLQGEVRTRRFVGKVVFDSEYLHQVEAHIAPCAAHLLRIGALSEKFGLTEALIPSWLPDAASAKLIDRIEHGIAALTVPPSFLGPFLKPLTVEQRIQLIDLVAAQPGAAVLLSSGDEAGARVTDLFSLLSELPHRESSQEALLDLASLLSSRRTRQAALQILKNAHAICEDGRISELCEAARSFDGFDRFLPEFLEYAKHDDPRADILLKVVLSGPESSRFKDFRKKLHLLTSDQVNQIDIQSAPSEIVANVFQRTELAPALAAPSVPKRRHWIDELAAQCPTPAIELLRSTVEQTPKEFHSILRRVAIEHPNVLDRFALDLLQYHKDEFFKTMVHSDLFCDEYIARLELGLQSCLPLLDAARTAAAATRNTYRSLADTFFPKNEGNANAGKESRTAAPELSDAPRFTAKRLFIVGDGFEDKSLQAEIRSDFPQFDFRFVSSSWYQIWGMNPIEGDAVILNVQRIHHKGSYYTQSLCDRREVPFLMLTRPSKSSLAMLIAERLEPIQ